MGQVNLTDLSDQVIMEALVEELTDQCKRHFKCRKGTYKEPCKWYGIRCNARRQVTDITWESTDNEPLFFMGAISFSNLPPHLRSIHVGTDNPDDEFFELELLSNDTAALPHTLEALEFENVETSGLIDLRRLPPSMNVFGMKSCGVVGACCLTALPRALTWLLMSSNYLEGSISLDYLPPLLTHLDLSTNNLSGMLNLKRLPRTLAGLILYENFFFGEIDVRYLPQDMAVLDIANNELSGEFKLTNPPKKLMYIIIVENSFKPVVVSKQALPFLKADFACVGDIVRPNGVPYTAAEIERNKKKQDDELEREERENANEV